MSVFVLCVVHRYKYETTISHATSNMTESALPCLANGSLTQDDEPPTAESQAGETHDNETG